MLFLTFVLEAPSLSFLSFLLDKMSVVSGCVRRTVVNLEAELVEAEKVQALELEVSVPLGFVCYHPIQSLGDFSIPDCKHWNMDFLDHTRHC